MACEIVAELSNAHNGDRDRLGRLIDAAKAAGADACKFQAYLPEELVALRGDGPAPEPWGSQGYTMRTLYEKAQTPLEWFPKIAAHCERIGMPWFSSCFGKASLDVLQEVGCPRLKVSHFECHNYDLLQLLWETRKPVLVSYPDASDRSGHIYCPGGYPATVAQMHLTRPIWGLSTHCLDTRVFPIAVALGAQYLEVHMMLRDEPSELEANVSLTEDQFAAMVRTVRAAEVICS